MTTNVNLSKNMNNKDLEKREGISIWICEDNRKWKGKKLNKEEFNEGA